MFVNKTTFISAKFLTHPIIYTQDSNRSWYQLALRRGIPKQKARLSRSLSPYPRGSGLDSKARWWGATKFLTARFFASWCSALRYVPANLLPSLQCISGQILERQRRSVEAMKWRSADISRDVERDQTSQKCFPTELLLYTYVLIWTVEIGFASTLQASLMWGDNFSR